jgi:hypothetical protein
MLPPSNNYMPSSERLSLPSTNRINCFRPNPSLALDATNLVVAAASQLIASLCPPAMNLEPLNAGRLVHFNSAMKGVAYEGPQG